jgi:hypothetical protein
MITDGVDIYKQSFGRGDWLIGLEGTNKEAITRRFWSFWNWKATSGELDWWTDKFAVFWSDEERFTQAVLDAARTRVINEFGDDLKGQKGGADTLAIDEAERVMSGIKEERFLTDKMMSVETNTHAQLQISAEDLSDWDARKA